MVMLTSLNRKTVCLLVLILIAASLLAGTAQAAKNYNSSKSNSTSVNIIVPDVIPNADITQDGFEILQLSISGEITIDNEIGTHWTITTHFETTGGDLVLIKNNAGLMVFHNGDYLYTITTPDPTTLDNCKFSGFEPLLGQVSGCKIGPDANGATVIFQGYGEMLLEAQGGEDDIRGVASVLVEGDGTVQETLFVFEEECEEGCSGSSVAVHERANYGAGGEDTLTTLIVDGEVVSVWAPDIVAADPKGMVNITTGPGSICIIRDTTLDDSDEEDECPDDISVIKMEAIGVSDGSTDSQSYQEFSIKPIRLEVGHVVQQRDELVGSLRTSNGTWMLSTHDYASAEDYFFWDTGSAWIIIDDGKIEAYIPMDEDSLKTMLTNPPEGSVSAGEPSTGRAGDGNGTTDNGTENEQSGNGSGLWDEEARQGIVIMEGGSECITGVTIVNPFSAEEHSFHFRGVYEDPISGTGYTIMQDDDATLITINGELVGLITREGATPIERQTSDREIGELLGGISPDATIDEALPAPTTDNGDTERDEPSGFSKAADAIVPDDPGTAAVVGGGLAATAGVAGTIFGRRGGGGGSILRRFSTKHDTSKSSINNIR
jgi:hypothetical protein